MSVSLDTLGYCWLVRRFYWRGETIIEEFANRLKVELGFFAPTRLDCGRFAIFSAQLRYIKS